MFVGSNPELRRERLGRFLNRLAPVAALFGLVETWAAVAFDDRRALASALVILLYSEVALAAARLATLGKTGPACTLASAGIVVSALVLVVLQPELHPALALVPLLGAVIAYPYVGGRALIALLGAALTATATIAVTGLLLPPSTRLPPLFTLVYLAAATTTVVAFIAYFLWQYRIHVEARLRGAEGRRTQLERAIAELTGREREARRLSLRDPLTGLANRRLLLDRLEEMVRSPGPDDRLAALVFLDLDGFKEVNDKLGHERGDRVLAEVATALDGGVRKTDTLSRFGGDEFALLMPRVASSLEPEQVAERLLHRLVQGLAPLPLELRISASIGIALFPDHGHTPERLLRAADAAMYRAKLAGGARFAWAAPVELRASDLEAALGRGAAGEKPVESRAE
jgi:diguanylate cyclase (GGDEF)-like protein